MEKLKNKLSLCPKLFSKPLDLGYEYDDKQMEYKVNYRLYKDYAKATPILTCCLGGVSYAMSAMNYALNNLNFANGYLGLGNVIVGAGILATAGFAINALNNKNKYLKNKVEVLEK